MQNHVRKELSGLANRFETFVFDLDGVVYRGQQVLPHAVATLNRLHEAGRQIFFLTNNSGATREQYAQKLLAMGIPATPEQIITSGWATANYLLKAIPNATVFVVGEPGLKEELVAHGFRLIENPDETLPDAVVVGIDREFTYERLAQAQDAILEGARFIATNTDPTYPAEHRLLPGAGAVVAAIATASGRKPIVIGKPNSEILMPLIQQRRINPHHTLLVGDRLDTDIALANHLHIPSALVLTGVAQRADLECAPMDLLPTWVLNHLGELLGDAVENLLIHPSV
ncbi:MAG: hypothetical protein C4337_06490 [Armatimonadota bacterium]|mgnify:CR=1 FL=1